jgi:hypothetical protein
MSQIVATGTQERPLIFVTDNDGHNYLIPLDEEKRFYKWVEYMESEDEDAKWEGHEYDSLGSDPTCYKIIGEVRL